MSGQDKPKPGMKESLSINGRRNKLIFLGGFTLIHMLLTVIFFFWSFMVVMANADDELPLPKTGEVLLKISDVLTWPLIRLFEEAIFVRAVIPPGGVIIIVFLNSLLWACVALGIIVVIRKVFNPRRRTD